MDGGDCDWRKSEDYCECECCEGKWTLDVDCSAGAEVCASRPCQHGGPSFSLSLLSRLLAALPEGAHK